MVVFTNHWLIFVLWVHFITPYHIQSHMNKIKILDKEFAVSIPFERIQSTVNRMADKISADYENKEPVFLCVLNGAFMFAADLLKAYTGKCEISFIKLASYAGIKTTGNVRTLIGLEEDIKGRDVVILEDIVDSGITISHLIEDLKSYEPASIKIAALLLKPAAVQKDVRPDYVGLEIPNDFIVGYGLDYNGFGRNLKDIYKITE